MSVVCANVYHCIEEANHSFHPIRTDSRLPILDFWTTLYQKSIPPIRLYVLINKILQNRTPVYYLFMSPRLIDMDINGYKGLGENCGGSYEVEAILFYHYRWSIVLAG